MQFNIGGLKITCPAALAKAKQEALDGLPAEYYQVEYDSVAGELALLPRMFTEADLDSVVEERSGVLEVRALCFPVLLLHSPKARHNHSAGVVVVPAWHRADGAPVDVVWPVCEHAHACIPICACPSLTCGLSLLQMAMVHAPTQLTIMPGVVPRRANNVRA